VRFFGTEGRNAKVGKPETPGSNTIHNFLVFEGKNIQDLVVQPKKQPETESAMMGDPAIRNAAPPANFSPYGPPGPYPPAGPYPPPGPPGPVPGPGPFYPGYMPPYRPPNAQKPPTGDDVSRSFVVDLK